MNTGAYDAFATVWGMKMHYLLVANRKKRRLGSILEHLPDEGPRQLAPVHGDCPVYQYILDPFGPPVGVAVSRPAGHRTRVEDHKVRPEALPYEAPVLETNEQHG